MGGDFPYLQRLTRYDNTNEPPYIASRISHTSRQVKLFATILHGMPTFSHQFCSVVVITFASHAEGLRFEPGQN